MTLQEEFNKLNKERIAAENRWNAFQKACEVSPLMKLNSGLTLLVKANQGGDGKISLRLKSKGQEDWTACEILFNEIDIVIDALKEAKRMENMSEEDILKYAKIDRTVIQKL